MYTSVTSTRSKVKFTGLLKFPKLQFSRSISSAILTWSSNWWLMMIVFDLVHSMSEPDFRIPFYESYHVSSNFAECRHCTDFKWPYFCIAWGWSHTVGLAGSPTGIVHANVTLTQSKVKIMGLLKFWKLHFSRSSPPALQHGAQKWWLIMIIRDLVYSLLEPDFQISF